MCECVKWEWNLCLGQVCPRPKNYKKNQNANLCPRANSANAKTSWQRCTTEAHTMTIRPCQELIYVSQFLQKFLWWFINFAKTGNKFKWEFLENETYNLNSQYRHITQSTKRLAFCACSAYLNFKPNYMLMSLENCIRIFNAISWLI